MDAMGRTARSRECLVVFAANQSVAPGQLANATGVTTVALRSSTRHVAPASGCSRGARAPAAASRRCSHRGRRLRLLVTLARARAARGCGRPVVVGYRHRDGPLLHASQCSFGVAAGPGGARQSRMRRAATRDRQCRGAARAARLRERACARAGARLCDVRASGRAATPPVSAGAAEAVAGARQQPAPLVYARGPGDLHRRGRKSRRHRRAGGTATPARRVAGEENNRPNCARCRAAGRFHRGCAR